MDLLLKLLGLTDSGSSENPAPPSSPTHFDPIKQVNEIEEWKERCTVITRSDHEEYLQYANEVVEEIIENLPSKDPSVLRSSESLELQIDKLDTKSISSIDNKSISSAEFTPSESSFDTAKEDLHSLPDLLQPESIHDCRDPEKSETDYESAAESDDFLLRQCSDTTLVKGFTAEGILDKPLLILDAVTGDVASSLDSSVVSTDLSSLVLEETLVVSPGSNFSSGDASEVDLLNQSKSKDLKDVSQDFAPSTNAEFLTAEFVETKVEDHTPQAVETEVENQIAQSEKDISNKQKFDELSTGLKFSVCLITSKTKRQSSVDTTLTSEDICNSTDFCNSSTSDVFSLGEVEETTKEPVPPTDILPSPEINRVNSLLECLEKLQSLSLDDCHKALTQAEEPEAETPELLEICPTVVLESETASALSITDSLPSEVADCSSSLPIPTESSVSGSEVPISSYESACSKVETLSEPAEQGTETSPNTSEDFVTPDDSPVNENAAQLVNSFTHKEHFQETETDNLTYEVDNRLDHCLENHSELNEKDVLNHNIAQELNAVTNLKEEELQHYTESVQIINSILDSVKSQLVESDNLKPSPAADILDNTELNSLQPNNNCEESNLLNSDNLASSESIQGDVLVNKSSELTAFEKFEQCVAAVDAQLPSDFLETASGIVSSENIKLVTSEDLVSSDVCENLSQSTIQCSSPVDQKYSEHSLADNFATSLASSQESEKALTGQDDEFDIEREVEKEAARIAEELINLSLQETPEDTSESQVSELKSSNQIMKEKMEDVENNETPLPVSGNLNLDENINPFQSKSKLACSPPRESVKADNISNNVPGKGDVKNGEVTPKKSPTSAVRRGSRTKSISPKRKGIPAELSTPRNQGECPENLNNLLQSPRSHSEDEKSSSPSTDTPRSARNQKVEVSSDSELQSLPEDILKVGDHASPKEKSASPTFKKPFPKATPKSKAGSANSEEPQVELESKEDDLPSQVMVRSLEGERNHSEAGPDVAEFPEEEFKSAIDFFKDPAAFEFLQKAGNNKFSESALARMSLYVKFDPLLKAISPIPKQHEKNGAANEDLQASANSEDLLLLDASANNDASKQIASSPVASRGLIDMTPPPQKSQREVADSSRPASRIYSEEELTQALRMQELLFQEQLLNKDTEWDEKFKHKEKECSQYATQAQKQHESQQQMRQVIVEYEKTISQLITDREKDKEASEQTILILRKERDQALEDLQNVETAFGDLHRRYEKTKSAVEGFKKNEEALKICVAESQNKVKKHEQRYELLKNHAEEKLEYANQEIKNLMKVNESELAALRAQLKKAEMKINSLERSLEQKNRENSELTSICDELIAKVGQGNS